MSSSVLPMFSSKSFIVSGLTYFYSVLAGSGSHKKIPQNEWLKQEEFLPYSSGGWEVQDQGTNQFVPGKNHLPALPMTVLLLCSDVAEGKRALFSLPLHIRTLIPSLRPCLPNVCLQILLQWGLGLQQINCGKTHSVHNVFSVCVYLSL